jgi:hypothetical protein
MPHPTRARALLAALALALAALGAAGCGDNVCTDKEQRLAECFGSDEDGEPIADDTCTGDTEAEASCVVDASCDDIKSGKAFTDCGAKK